MSQSSVKNNDFLANMHTGVLISYFVTVLFLVMIYTNPIYLFFLFGMVALGICSCRGLKEWGHTLRFGLVMIFFIILINIFISRAGQTILWEGPKLPILGKLSISEEAIIFGFVMAFKLSLILSIFCWYETAVPTDKTFSFVSRGAAKSALVLILTAMLIPQMKRRLSDIVLAMQVRGYELQPARLGTMIRQSSPILKVALLSMLEDSWQTAEALQSKAFGTGPRTSYIQDVWRRRDSLVLAFLSLSWVGCIISFLKHRGFANFYPKTEISWTSQDVILISGICAGLLVLPFLNELGRRWKFLKFII